MGSPQSQTRVVLVADDDEFIRDHVGALLAASGVTVEYASDGAEAIRSLSDRLDTLVVDLDMPGATGLEVLAVASRKFPRLPVIMLSGAGQVEDAVVALKRGAFDYLQKPFDEEELMARVREALRVNKLETENRQLRAYQSEATEGVRLVMTSPSSIALKERAARCAGVDSTVLITGPSGTGKSVLARWIHQQGPRSAGPFVAVNCGALPRELIESELFGHEKGAFTGATASRLGRFEAAAGGTLFLDEIGELPLDLQPKLLHAIQDRVITRLGSVQAVPVDVRLIAATNRDLEQAITERLFREDLYYRLNVLSLEIASLRARREDILPIAAHTLERIARRLGVLSAGLTEKASEAMLQHDWPGNVRELENILERAMVFPIWDRWSAGNRRSATTPSLAHRWPRSSGGPSSRRSPRTAATGTRRRSRWGSANGPSTTGSRNTAGLSTLRSPPTPHNNDERESVQTFLQRVRLAHLRTGSSRLRALARALHYAHQEDTDDLGTNY